jgi:hypothetical protein
MKQHRSNGSRHGVAYSMNSEGGKARTEDTVDTEWPNTYCEA